jgi:hypothetical protein
MAPTDRRRAGDRGLGGEPARLGGDAGVLVSVTGGAWDGPAVGARVARERRCDHVFLAGGDAVGGSTPTREVVRAIRERFRGLVTVLAGVEPAGYGDTTPG